MTGDFKGLIIQVISSWQVIAVTIAVLLYIFLINFVGRVRRRRRLSPLPKIPKKAKNDAKNKGSDDIVDDSNLGIGE